MRGIPAKFVAFHAEIYEMHVYIDMHSAVLAVLIMHIRTPRSLRTVQLVRCLRARSIPGNS